MTVNGERVTKARLQSGDEVMFGDCRVIVTFGDAMSDAGQMPAPQAWGGGRQAPQPRVVAAGDGVRARPPSSSTRRRPAYADKPAPSSRTPRRRSRARPVRAPRSRFTEQLAGDGGPDHLHGVVTGTRHLFNPEGKNAHRPGFVDALRQGLGVRRAGARTYPCLHRNGRRARRRHASKQWTAGGREHQKASPGRTVPRAAPRSCSAACSAPSSSRTWASSIRGKTSPNFLVGSDGDVDAPVSLPRYVPSSSHAASSRRRALTTSSTSPRA